MNKITHEGKLNFSGIGIPCYILEDGTRVISTSAMQRALGVVTDGKERSATRLTDMLSSKVVSRFISDESLAAKLSPIDCYKGRGKITAYDATTLPEICEVMLKVRDYALHNNIQLGVRQQAVVKEADVIIRSLARVGIIALIDEATGYQYDREKDELQKILKAYIAEELLPWQKRFPDVFYKELFRLNGWDFDVKGIRKRLGVIGKWTNTLIYEQLPNGVLDELKRKTPNKAVRYHQYLTTDTGEPNLTNQINQIITLFTLSDTMEDMWENFKKLKERQQRYLDRPFNFDDKGHTVDNGKENHE